MILLLSFVIGRKWHGSDLILVLLCSFGSVSAQTSESVLTLNREDADQIRLPTLSASGHQMAYLADQALVLWDFQQGKQLLRIDADQLNCNVQSLAIRSDNQEITLACQSDTVKRIKCKNGKIRSYYCEDIGMLAYLPNGDLLGANEYEPFLLKWSSNMKRPKDTLLIQTDDPQQILFGPTHLKGVLPKPKTNLYYSAYNDELYFTCLEKSKESAVLNKEMAGAGSYYLKTLAAHPTQSLLALGINDAPVGRQQHGEIHLVNVNSRTSTILPTRWEVNNQAQQQWIHDIVFSPDGNTLAVAGRLSEIFLFDIQTRESIGYLSGAQNTILSIHMTPDTNFVLATDMDNQLYIYDYHTRQLLIGLTSFQQGKAWVIQTPDGIFSTDPEDKAGLGYLTYKSGDQEYPVTTNSQDYVPELLADVWNQRSEDAYRSAKLAYGQGQYNKAESSLRGAMRIGGSNPELLLFMGQIQDRLANYNEAIQSLEEAMKLAMDASDNRILIQVLEEKIKIYSSLGTAQQKVRQDINQLRELDPLNDIARTYQSQIRARSGSSLQVEYEPLQDLPDTVRLEEIDLEFKLIGQGELEAKIFCSTGRVEPKETDKTYRKGSITYSIPIKLHEGENFIEIYAGTDPRNLSPVNTKIIFYVPIIEREDIAYFFVNDRYKYPSSWKPLDHAWKNAEEIAEELKEHYHFETKLFRNKTEEQIRNILLRLQDRRYKADAQLLIFFSGHGAFDDKSKTGYYVPFEGKTFANDPNWKTYFSLETLGGTVNQIPCKHILLAIDACYSGAIDRSIADRGDDHKFGRKGDKVAYKQRKIADELSDKSRLVITSGGIERTPSYSQFAQQILNALQSQEAKEDGFLTYASLRGHLSKAIPTPHEWKLEDSCNGGFVFERQYVED